MGAVPKKKHTRSRSNKRKNSPSKQGGLPTLTECPSCKKLTEPHKACFYCGTYKDKVYK